MKNSNKTKEQLLIEIEKLNDKIAKLKDTAVKNYIFLENSPVCTQMVDLDFNLQYMSSSGVRDLKIDDITEFYGKPYPLHFYPDSFKVPMINNMKKVKKNRKIITQEASALDVDGNKLWYHSTIIPINDDKGKLDYLLIVSRNITERKKAEQVLKESENLFREIFHTSPDAFSISSLEDGLMVDVNQGFCDITGYKREEVIGKLSEKINIWSKREDRTKFIKKLKKSEQVVNMEFDFLRKNGQVIPALLSSQSIEINGVPHLLNVAKDITDLKQAESKLKNSEQFLNGIFESVQDGVSVLNPDLTISRVNGLMNKWYKDNLPLEGKKCYEVYHNADKPCDPCPSLRCLKSGKTENNIVHGLKGSSVEFIELFSYPIKDPKSNEVIGVVEYVRDITERKQVENELIKSEKRLNIIFDSAPDAYYLNDFEGKFIDGNKAAEKLLGYTKEELIGKNFLDVGILPMDQIEKTLKVLEKNISGKSSGPDEYELIRKDGSTVSVGILTHPVEINGDGLVLGLARDITARKQTENKLISRNKELEMFNDITVGRELKMIELKKEINKLLEQSGGKPKYKIVA